MIIMNSIAKKVLVSVSAILAVISVLLTYSLIHERSNQVETEVLQQVRLVSDNASSGIHEFFRERSRVVTSIEASPFVNDWFRDYTERGSAIEGDKQYQQIVRFFKDISAHDPMIKSVFYAPANTFEYFDINGRYNDSEYFTNKRPWWFEALEKDSLFITNPEIDANDGSIVTSIKTPVKTMSNELIGVLGIDILASEIKNGLIDQMNYQGKGKGFLFTKEGQLISFPDPQARLDMSKLPTLNDVDSRMPNTTGFHSLLQRSQSESEIVDTITLDGIEYITVIKPIIDHDIQLDWRLGFIVPKTFFTEPLNKAIFLIITIMAAIFLLTCVTIMGTTNQLLGKPLRHITGAMDDIAVGDGDLTKRLDESRQDELGTLSKSFNAFVHNIQSTITQCNTAATDVEQESNQVQGLSRDLASNINTQKQFIEQIATAATEMTQTIHGISESAQTALSHASNASIQSIEGQQLASEANALMTDIFHDVSESERVVTELHENSNSIASVLSVIKEIADQTNLLALNAAIEAARAGEQGRGFAVVADEVRTLAGRTQHSTGDIEAIIEKLQHSASNAVNAMHVGREKTERGVQLISDFDEKLGNINQAVNLIETQSQEIASMVKEQAIASSEISEQTVSVNQLAEQTVEQTSEMASKSASQIHIVQELSSNISKFKV